VLVKKGCATAFTTGLFSMAGFSPKGGSPGKGSEALIALMTKLNLSRILAKDAQPVRQQMAGL
jgi:hypothetical protein